MLRCIWIEETIVIIPLACRLQLSAFPYFQNRDFNSVSQVMHAVVHYENTPMQYTAIFHGCKNVNFLMKNYNIFLFKFALKH